MPCEHPNTAFRPANGGPVLFKRPQHLAQYDQVDLPCGYCILCREEQARQWAVRISHEAQLHEHNSFVTLTYATEHIPEHGSLNYHDLVKFWKRLRKAVGRLRYYAVGEYGDKSLRPHYHACIFGHSFIRERIILRTTPYLTWTSPELVDAWGLGNVEIGALNFRTARYTASYIAKKLRSKQVYVRTDTTTGELIPITQPRAFMSRNIGKDWWDQYGQHTTDHDFVIIDGRKQKPPKAYDRWLGEADQERQEEIKESRKAFAEDRVSTPEKTHARAQNAHARAERKTKSV